MIYHYKLKHGAIGSVNAESEGACLARLRRVWGENLLQIVSVWTDDGKIVLDRGML